jgi:uncharacterized protein DUF4145
MSSGSFDCLSSLDQNLCEDGNEAERLVDSPRYCFVALRGWLETVLGFLERQHAIPPLPMDRQGKGEIQYRIDRLPENGVSVSRSGLSAMHDIRIDGNDGAHPHGKKHRFTRANAEAALRNAGMIRDWLDQQYVRPARVPRRVPRSARSNHDLSRHTSSISETETKGSGYRWKLAAGVVLLLTLWAFVSRNSASRSADQHVGSDKQIEDARRTERERAANQQQIQADKARRRQEQLRQSNGR